MSDNALLSARDYTVQVDGLIERGRYAQARMLIGEALSHYPQDSGLLFASARIDYDSGAADDARSTLQEILARDPDDYLARSLMVNVLQDAGDLPGAELLLIDLLREYPEAAFQYARYALLMYRTLHIDKAKALAREAYRLDPNNELALTTCLIGDIIDGRRGAEQAGLARLLQGHPESENTARMLITHLLARGRYRAAKRIAVELLKLYPNSREILALVVQLDALSHWSMLPLWPFNRWGAIGSVAFYVITLVVLNLVRSQAPLFSSVATYTVIGYCLYSWIYPPLLTRWLKRRAGL
jgi:tetratricopeptide (TPR) repeat protein